MKFNRYSKDLDYSYSLGAFPTLELIKYHKEDIISILIHSSFKNQEVINKIFNSLEKDKIIYDDKAFSKLSSKENVYIIGVFRKYKMKIDSNANHILLDSISNMGNLGTIIRSSLGFDIKNMVLVDQNIDFFDPKVIRASMGAIFSINIEHFNTLIDYKKTFSEHTIYSFMLNASNSLAATKFNSNLSTLAFGNEAHGLSDEYLDNNSIIIKHSNLIDSLNITNAVTIALYEFYNQKGSK